MNDLRDLYEELILDHNRSPRNYPVKPEGTNRSAHGYNPLCGDEFHVHIKMENGIVEDVGFEGIGCAISTASASLMTEALKGKSEHEAQALFDEVHRLLTEAQPGEDAAELIGKLSVLMGVKEYPMRVKCATLAWHTLQAALKQNSDTVSTE